MGSEVSINIKKNYLQIYSFTLLHNRSGISYLAFFLTEVLLIYNIILTAIITQWFSIYILLHWILDRKHLPMTECPASLLQPWLIKGLITNKHFLEGMTCVILSLEYHQRLQRRQLYLQKISQEDMTLIALRFSVRHSGRQFGSFLKKM